MRGAYPVGRDADTHPGMTGSDTGHSTAVREMDPKDPSTLYSEGPVAAEPPDDDVPETSPVPDSGGVGPGPDDLDRLLGSPPATRTAPAAS